jgi:hypothetical protein
VAQRGDGKGNTLRDRLSRARKPTVRGDDLRAKDGQGFENAGEPRITEVVEVPLCKVAAKSD